MKYLVDTSLWIDHFKSRNGNPILEKVLFLHEIWTHSMIIGELLLGGFLRDSSIQSSLKQLPKSTQESADVISDFILNHSLIGKSIGWVDCNILHASLNHTLILLTLDKALNNAFQDLSLKKL